MLGIIKRAVERRRALRREVMDLIETHGREAWAIARGKLTLWRYDYNHVRPHSSLGNKAPAEARRALELFDGTAPGALAIPETENYQPQGLSL